MMCNIIVAAIVLLNYGYVESGSNPLTTEGGENTNIKEHKFMASIYTKEHRCSGIIISAKLLLTTAVCENSIDLNLTKVHVGSPTGGENKSISYTLVNGDISILVIKETTTFNNETGALYVPKKKELVLSLGYGTPITALEFVKGGNGSHAQQLQEAKLMIVNNNECKRFGVQMTTWWLCARNINITLSEGDDGSPVFYGEMLIGIVFMTVYVPEKHLSVITKVSKNLAYIHYIMKNNP